MRRLLQLALLALLLLLPHPSHAAWSNDPDANLMVTNVTSNQAYPVACSDGAGGVIVAWEDFRNGTDWNIYAQRVSHNGSVLWTANGRSVCTSTGNQFYTAICSDGSGGAIIAWKDIRSGTNYDIYAQRLNSSGTAQWTTNGVALCTNTADQGRPYLCADGSGGAIATWTDPRGADNDIYARRVSSAGTPQWTANGTAVCTAAGEQSEPCIVSDGASGAILAWDDQRNGNRDVYAQRLNSSGTAQWTSGGIALCDETSSQNQLAIATDDRGGAYVAWTDMRNGNEDIYMQKVSHLGGQWATDGFAICDQTVGQVSPAVTADGEHGVIVTWADGRGVDDNIYAQRVRETGFLQWTDNGVSVCSATGNQIMPLAVPDGSGGAVISWIDSRVGAYHRYARRVSDLGVPQWSSNGVALSLVEGITDNGYLVEDGEGGAILLFGSDPVTVGDWDIYAQNVDHFGAIGDAAPAITGVHDVRADQGGQVVIEWTPSYRDAEPTFTIDAYSIWRQVPSALEQARATATIGADRRAVRTTVENAQTLYWEYVGEQPARGRTGYSFVAPTTTDSMAGSNPYTRFMVSAEEAGGTPYWDSPADSGYSVDNIAPPTPAPFTGTYANASAILGWGASAASDFAAFQLYRGTSAGFVPGAGNLVTTTTTGGYSDAAPTLYYKLCAVDVHGNASPYASLYLSGAVDVPGANLPREVFLAAPAPNPARAGTSLRFGLPREARVALALHDAQGRRVRTLRAGTLPAGEHAATWDGADDAGRALPAGVYVVRLEVEGRALTRRLALVR